MPSLVILSGAPGTGKTTVAALLAAASPHGVHLPTDLFYDVVLDGIVGPWFLPLVARTLAEASIAAHYVVLRAPLTVTLARS